MEQTRQRGHVQQTSHRAGFGRLDVLLVLLILALVGSLLSPAILYCREIARQRVCASRLRQMVAGLNSYQSTHQWLPPAAVWRSGPGHSLALHASKRFDRTTYDNWAICLLPHLNHGALATSFDSTLPIGHPKHQPIREADLSTFTCPSDELHTSENRYQYSQGERATKPLTFARGNFAINGGTHNPRLTADSTTSPRGEAGELVMDSETGEYRLLGNGIAGFNVALHPERLQNGRSTLIAFEEVRSGLSPDDLRGVWSLGQIGSSVTWGHGIPGDDTGPNNSWERADDIIGCAKLHKTLGKETVQQSGMSCPDYIDSNDQATARSQHSGGVNVAFLDGSARFVANEVDAGLWHVMHSRNTSAELLALPDFAQQLVRRTVPEEASTQSPSRTLQQSAVPDPAPPASCTNSIGMNLVSIPAGEYTMGVPDRGNGADPPPECPIHQVRISRPFLLGQSEVTQKQYELVMQQNPSFHTAERTGLKETSNLPVENVSWNDCAEFCRRLSAIPEEAAAGRQYRLPTEAEWEYACRAGKSTPYAWQRTRDANDDSGEAAGVYPPLPLTPVGTYRPNSMGLFDMRGNVWEWCSDWFDRTYYSRSPTVDPQGPASGFIKVVRGGDWVFVGETCRINYVMMPPSVGGPFVGFRVACDHVGPR